MLAVSMQCWRMVRALRSHGWHVGCRCLFWRDVAVHLSFSNFLCDYWLPLVDSDLSNVPYDRKDLCVFCRTYTSVDSLTTKTAGPLKRPSSSTIASLNDITGLFASCYKSHGLPTCLRPLHYVVLLHDFNVSFNVLPLLTRISLLAVVP